MSRVRAALVALGLGVTLAAQTPTSLALLHRSDVGGFVPASCRARLSMQQISTLAGGVPSPVSEIELFRGGANRTLVRFLDPKERGKYLLRLGADLWFIAPGARNPVHLSPTHRLYGAATLDVLLGMHVSEDYRITGTTSQSSPSGPLTLFDLQAISPAQQFATVRYTVQNSTERPVSALYRLASGREATLIEFFDWVGGNGGQRYARHIQVHDLLRKGELTRIEALEFEERALPEGLFDLHDPTARQAMERGGR